MVVKEGVSLPCSMGIVASEIEDTFKKLEKLNNPGMIQTDIFKEKGERKMIENKSNVKNDPVVDLQRAAMEHRAKWTGLTYVKAREAGKAEETEKIIRQAITETGKISGAKLKSQCQDSENVAYVIDTFLTPFAKPIELEYKEKTKDRVDLEFHYCPILNAWQDLGFDDETCEKLCDMAMDGDRGLAKALGYEFFLGDTIA